MADPDGVGLDKAIEALRAEVAAAAVEAAGQDVQFPVQTLTVELKVAVTKKADGSAGFKVPFVGAELGGSGGYARETIQTVTLVMGPPVDRLGRPVKIAKSTDEERK